MTRTRRRRLYGFLPGLGVIAGFLGQQLIGGWQTILLAGVAYMTLWMPVREYLIRFRLPAQTRERLECLVDPSAGPPAGATPADVPPVARAIADAVNARDSRALAAALDPKFRCVNEHAERSVGRRKYVQYTRHWRRLFPSTTFTIDAAATDDPRSEAVWVRLNRAVTPRRGKPFEVTWWERWTLDSAHARVLESRPTGYVRVI